MKELPSVPPYEIINGYYTWVEPEGNYHPLTFGEDNPFLTSEVVSKRLRNQANVNLYEVRGARYGTGGGRLHLTYRKQVDVFKLGRSFKRSLK